MWEGCLRVQKAEGAHDKNLQPAENTTINPNPNPNPSSLLTLRYVKNSLEK